MIPLVELTLKECDGTTFTECGYVAVVDSVLSEDGSFVTDELSAYIQAQIEDVKEVTFDDVTYLVHSKKYLPSTCATKVNAFRTYVSGCDVCNGTLHTALTPDDCTDDTESVSSGTPVTFASRHINTSTRAFSGGLVSHVQLYELTFSGRPALNSDNVIVCGSTKFKIKEVFDRTDIRKPLRATAELTVRPRATV